MLKRCGSELAEPVLKLYACPIPHNTRITLRTCKLLSAKAHRLDQEEGRKKVESQNRRHWSRPIWKAADMISLQMCLVCPGVLALEKDPEKLVQIQSQTNEPRLVRESIETGSDSSRPDW